MVTKKKLIEFLEERGLYEDVDDAMIDELYFNFQVMKQAKTDIKERGLLTPINTSGTLTNQNPSIAIYNSAFKNLLNASRRLGLSARDRKELGLSSESKSDGFEDD